MTEESAGNVTEEGAGKERWKESAGREALEKSKHRKSKRWKSKRRKKVRRKQVIAIVVLQLPVSFIRIYSTAIFFTWFNAFATGGSEITIPVRSPSTGT